MKRKSLDYHPSIPVPHEGGGTLPLFWQTMQAKPPRSPDAGSHHEDASAPTSGLMVPSFLESSTGTTGSAALASSQRSGTGGGTSDYSSQSMLNLDIEGTSFSDLVRPLIFLVC